MRSLSDYRYWKFHFDCLNAPNFRAAKPMGGPFDLPLDVRGLRKRTFYFAWELEGIIWSAENKLTFSFNWFVFCWTFEQDKEKKMWPILSIRPPVNNQNMMFFPLLLYNTVLRNFCPSSTGHLTKPCRGSVQMELHR